MAQSREDLPKDYHDLLHDAVRMYRMLKFVQKLWTRIGKMLDKAIWELELKYGMGVKQNGKF